MKRTEHTFTRADSVYDCVAKADGFAGASGFRRRPTVTGRTWWVTVGGAEYATIRWTGVEFEATPSRLAFEELIVESVGGQTPLPHDSVKHAPQVPVNPRVVRRVDFQSTTCPLCRMNSGVTRAPLKPRVTEIRCRRCGDFHIDDTWMAWADSTVLETDAERDALARQSCEANASGLLLELTEDARGTPQAVRGLPSLRSGEL